MGKMKFNAAKFAHCFHSFTSLMWVVIVLAFPEKAPVYQYFGVTGQVQSYLSLFFASRLGAQACFSAVACCCKPVSSAQLRFVTLGLHLGMMLLDMLAWQLYMPDAPFEWWQMAFGWGDLLFVVMGLVFRENSPFEVMKNKLGLKGGAARAMKTVMKSMKRK